MLSRVPFTSPRVGASHDGLALRSPLVMHSLARAAALNHMPAMAYDDRLAG